MNKRQRLRCLFLVPSLRRAGAETQVVDLVNGLDNDRFVKYLFTFHHMLEQRARVDQANIRLYNCPRRFKFDLTPVIQMARLINSEKIDVIHCTLQFSLLLAWLARMLSKSKPPIIATIHTTINRSLKQELLDRLIYHYLLRKCETVIFVCKNQRQYWIKRFASLRGNSEVIYNGIDASEFNPHYWKAAGKSLRKTLDIPDKAVVIACIAGFRPEKGHYYLMQAFAKLSSDVYLILAGDGERRPDIESMANEKGLSDRIRFLGNIDDVRPLLAMSELTVLASTAVETFSIAMLESMAMAVPMLATNIGGMSEAIISGETGYLVQSGNVDELSSTIARALKDRANLITIGQNARKYVIDNFTKENMVKRTAHALIAASISAKL